MTKDEFIEKLATAIGDEAEAALELAADAGLNLQDVHQMHDRFYALNYPSTDLLGEFLGDAYENSEGDPSVFRKSLQSIALVRTYRCVNEMSATGFFQARDVDPTFLFDELNIENIPKYQTEGAETSEIEAENDAVPYDYVMDAMEEKQGGSGVRLLIPLFAGMARPTGAGEDDYEHDSHWCFVELIGPVFDFVKR